jgi:hypothetical protein
MQKCHFLVISLSNSHSIPAQLFLHNEPLEQVKSYKNLGVEVDENFTFGKHTSKAVAKAKQWIGTLNRMLRKWASSTILSQAISTIALPAMFYAIEAWYPPHKKHQQQIERVIKFAARLLTNNYDHSIQYEDLLSKLNWKPAY